MPVVATDKLKHYKPLQSVTASQGFTIVPSDTDELPAVTTKLWVGSTGDISVILAGDTVAVILKSIPAGTMLDLRIKQVKASGTTASNMVGLV